MQMRKLVQTQTQARNHTQAQTLTQADTLGRAVPTLPRRAPFPKHTNIKQQYK